jgi:nicotinamide phosphoribosyltransferase
MKVFAPHLTDYYKVGHYKQYPEGTEYVYANGTFRSDKWANVLPDFDHKVVFFGLQGACQWLLVDLWNETFFSIPKEEAVNRYKRRMDGSLGVGAVSTKHISDLHDLGFLPVRIKALPEGSRVGIRVPVFTIINTLPAFYWVTNYLETQISAVIWKICTSATLAYEYRRLFEKYAGETGGDRDFIDFQGHDFSERGMSGIEDGITSGAGHLLSFKGTDSIPAIDYLEEYYFGTQTFVGGSVPATEHSVASCNMIDIAAELESKGQWNGISVEQLLDLELAEIAFLKNLITNIYPIGIVSYVADTYDYFRVITKVAKTLKETILSRDGKLVFRPDSGDPVKIIIGDPEAPVGSPEYKGSVECLWEIFGGTITRKGYKKLDKHVGLIYGDSITLDRAQAILAGLALKGFSSDNIVLGIGSYCVSVDTPVLCSDLVWRKAKELLIGEEIISFDETPVFGSGKKSARRYRKATITANTKTIKKSARISTDIGDPIIASLDHPWLVWVRNRSNKNMNEVGEFFKKDTFPRGAGLAWKRTSDLVPGDEIAFLEKPWKTDTSREGGWLEGIFDGEGGISNLQKYRKIPHYKINISQNKGPILDRINKELSDRLFTTYENERSCPQIVLTGGWSENLRFLGTIRPQRLLNKWYNLSKELPTLKKNATYRTAKVVSVEEIGLQELASITTSNGTFITGGYLSHNTYQYVTRDTFGFAIKATWGVVKGEERELWKDPKTDNGVKKSARGLLRVQNSHNRFILFDQQDHLGEQRGLLRVVFEDGKLYNTEALHTIRERLLEGEYA